MKLKASRTAVAVVFVAAVTAAVASAAPVPADPAVEDISDAELDAKLATTYQLETVSEGSTAGFATDPLLVSDPTITPGATGWWNVSGVKGSEFAIDSCGSAFTAELTAYARVPRTSDYKVIASTPDGCAEPLTGKVVGSISLAGPELIRIDDATGTGGEYTVSYSRTTASVSVKVGKITVGKVMKGKARVTARVHTSGGEVPIKTTCRLDGKKIVKNCAGETTVKKVKTGSHTLKVTRSDAYSRDREKVQFEVRK